MRFLFEDCVLDDAQHELRRGDRLVPVEPRIFKLLVHLICNRDRVVTPDDLREAIWDGRFVSASTLGSSINAARNAIGDNGGAQRLIRTLSRKGFRFVATVREGAATEHSTAPELPAAGMRSEFQQAADDRPTVAVFPLDPFGGDPELGLLANGLAEDIATKLSRISSIRVIAQETVAGNGRTDNRSAARELGARYFLAGNVRGSGQRIRVSAQLVDTASGHHVWAEQVDVARAELLQLEDDISKAIAASVQTQLILNEGKISAESDGQTESASQLLARAWQRFLGLTESSLADCRALTERALQINGKSTMGHRLLAVCLYHQIYMGFIPWTRDVVDEINTHAKLSIEADDADEYCHWAMGCALLLKKQHDRAIASLRRALEINPSCSLAYGSIGTVLAWASQCDASIDNNEYALRINPQDPSNFFRHFGLALAHYLASRYAKAVSHAGTVAQTRPSWWLAQFIYSASLAQLDRRDEANEIMSDLMRARPGINASDLSVLPFASASDREHLLAALRKAGLPG